jgi:acetyl esterase/lipase
MMEGQWGKFVIAGKALDKKASPEALIPTEAQTKLGQQLSPQNNVRAGLPPTLLMHGLDDHVVNPDQARKFAAAMTDAKNRCDLVLLEGARHAFILAKYTAPEELVVDVIHKVETFLTSLGYLSGDSTLTVSATPAWEPAGKKKK